MRLVLVAALLALGACSDNEEQIRAEERAKMLEERVAQLEAEKGEADRSGSAPEQSVGSADTPGSPDFAGARSAPPPRSTSELRDSGGPNGIIARYQAYIGADDLYNSSGKRLDRPWQILRQDRANYHRFGTSQRGDQSDPFFDSSENRQIMERMVANGSISSSAGRRIVAGDVLIEVEILGRGDRGEAVSVTVY